MYSILKVLQNFVGYGKANTEKRKLDFRFEMSDDMPWKMEGDPESLTKTGLDMLSNAVKYTNSGYIQLSAGWKQTEENKGQLCISVRDTGIAEEERLKPEACFLEKNVQKQPVYGEGMKFSYVIEQEVVPMEWDESCSNREVFQKELLTVFFKEEKVEDMEAFFEVKDWMNYRILAHELRGISRAIGALELSEMARQMELAAKEKNAEFLNGHHTKLISVCREVLQETKEKLFGKELEVVQNVVQEKSGYILVVDDDKKNSKVIKKILADRFEVERVNSGSDALKLLEKKTPDLILLDLHMPDMDGFEVKERLQNNQATQDIPVIFLTADRNRILESRAFKAGAQDLIVKPYVADVVFQRVSHVLELSRLQKNLQQEVRKQTQEAEERREKFEKLSKEIVQALVEAIDAKDAYTQGHSERVADYSVKIAERAGKNAEELDRIKYMGLLHDVGKIGIPDAIISKSSSLSDTEYVVTREHPAIGAKILEKITVIEGLDVGAKYHHERYDGTGYPEGLDGTNIPEEARIIAVADAYDAMASKRSYRDVLPQKVVSEEIQMGRGTQFDPVFADIMLELIEEDVDYDMREK